MKQNPLLHNDLKIELELVLFRRLGVFTKQKGKLMVLEKLLETKKKTLQTVRKKLKTMKEKLASFAKRNPAKRNLVKRILVKRNLVAKALPILLIMRTRQRD
jgi:hypothetical protein